MIEQQIRKGDLIVYPKKNKLCVWHRSTGYYTRPMSKDDMINLAFRLLEEAKKC